MLKFPLIRVTVTSALTACPSSFLNAPSKQSHPNLKDEMDREGGEEAVGEEGVGDSCHHVDRPFNIDEGPGGTHLHLSLSPPPSSPPSPASSVIQMSNKRSNSFRRAILQGSRQLRGCSLREEAGLGLSQRLVRHVAYETLPREVDRKWYFDSYTCCPPPWLMLAITIAEVRRAAVLDCLRRPLPPTLSPVPLLLPQVVVFMYYGFQLDRLVLQVSSPSFLKSPLPYHPRLRAQAWRYLSYIFMHTG